MCLIYLSKLGHDGSAGLSAPTLVSLALIYSLAMASLKRTERASPPQSRRELMRLLLPKAKLNIEIPFRKSGLTNTRIPNKTHYASLRVLKFALGLGLSVKIADMGGTIVHHLGGLHRPHEAREMVLHVPQQILQLSIIYWGIRKLFIPHVVRGAIIIASIIAIQVRVDISLVVAFALS